MKEVEIKMDTFADYYCPDITINVDGQEIDRFTDMQDPYEQSDALAVVSCLTSLSKIGAINLKVDDSVKIEYPSLFQ